MSKTALRRPDSRRRGGARLNRGPGCPDRRAPPPRPLREPAREKCRPVTSAGASTGETPRRGNGSRPRPSPGFETPPAAATARAGVSVRPGPRRRQRSRRRGSLPLPGWNAGPIRPPVGPEGFVAPRFRGAGARDGSPGTGSCRPRPTTGAGRDCRRPGYRSEPVHGIITSRTGRSHRRSRSCRCCCNRRQRRGRSPRSRSSARRGARRRRNPAGRCR